MAENGLAQSWLEWNRGLNPALTTSRPRFLTGLIAFAPLMRLALLAVFRIVLEFLVRKELLFSRREDKFYAATNAD